MPLSFLTFKNDGPVKVSDVTRAHSRVTELVGGGGGAKKLDESGEGEVPEKTIPTRCFYERKIIIFRRPFCSVLFKGILDIITYTNNVVTF